MQTFETRKPVPGKDKFTTEAEALARAKVIGCEGTHSMDENGMTIYMPCSTHAAYDKLSNEPKYADETRPYHDDEDDEDRAPAPKSEQIKGSDTNKPGSAKDAGGDVAFSEQTETALRNKVKEHNEAMEKAGKPPHTRTRYGQLASVYRRGSGAYSTSFRPGISRAAWSMARVNAFLYLLRNGRPKNAAYVTDNDLLPAGHPKSSRSAPEVETREVNLSPPSYMKAAARRGLALHAEGKSGDGLVDRTVREARAMVSGSVTADKWVKTAAWIARHLGDLDAPAAQPSSPNYPSPGVVAHLLWGSGPSKRAAQRVLDYANGVVARIEADNEGRAKGEALSKIETRVAISEFEIREDGTGMHFEGYAAVFNSPSEPLPFIERIVPGAFKRSIEARNDIKLLYNHDAGSVLGSTRAGTLKMYEDERGLKVSAMLPNTGLGRDTAELLRRGDLDSMSFGFSVPQGGDEWNASGSERTLTSVRLHEVSIVAFPAYAGTAGSTSVRGIDMIAERADVDPDALADAMLKLEEGSELSEEEGRLLSQAVMSSTVKAVVEEPLGDLAMLELKKKKLSLIQNGN